MRSSSGGEGRRSTGVLARRWLAFSVSLLLACSDSTTAPVEGDFQVEATPATVARTGPNAGIVSVTLSNNSSVTVAIDLCNETLEVETSPGVWVSPPETPVACIAAELKAHSAQTVMRGVPNLAGRMRLLYPYWFVTFERGGSNTPKVLFAYSNTFVVGP